jgi:hypothetical protein
MHGQDLAWVGQAITHTCQADEGVKCCVTPSGPDGDIESETKEGKYLADNLGLDAHCASQLGMPIGCAIQTTINGRSGFNPWMPLQYPKQC